MSADVATLANLGPVSAGWLRAVGVRTRDDLAACGPVAAYLAVKQAGFAASLNLLWALAAALDDRHWTALAADEKQALRDELAAAG
jgi:TfoX/Sxy family transcriptional regulator of competence genes